MKSIPPSITPQKYLDMVVVTFLEAGDPLRAEKQRAYMRHQFEYCGLGAPLWMRLARDLFSKHGMFTGKALEEYVKLSLNQEYREVQYVSIEMMQRMLPYQTKSWIRVLEHCVVTQSWWDTVDWLAKLVGMHFLRFPELQRDYAYRWIESENIWLQRVAIIHQLFFRENTEEKLLFDMIRRRAESKEFFIQKACGWALRQYAKTNPKAVEKFLAKTDVSKLTIREAQKQLNK